MIKNETELEGFRQCHIRDGVALVRYFAWLEEQLDNGVVLDECQAADKLEEYRSYVHRWSIMPQLLIGCIVNWIISKDCLFPRYLHLDQMPVR